MRYQGRTGKIYNLPNDPFAQGGEGKLFNITGEPSLVAKLYKSGKNTYEKELKLIKMVQNPPDSSALDKIAWPTDVLYDTANRFAGFVMPKLAKNEDLNVIYEYGSAAKYPNISWRNKIVIAKNLCVVLNAVHSAGHVVGDLNPKNISVNPNNGHISFFDADSFHITDGKRVFRCEVGVPEYLASEIQKKMKNGATLSTAPLPTFSTASDNFALAIHIFQLLMNGTHPFSCRVLPSQYSVAFPQPVDNIVNGDFPFMNPKAGTTIPVFAPPLSILPQELQDMFRRAFIDGHLNPSQRPDAVEWYNALTTLERNLKKCGKVPTHAYYNQLNDCPWCAADKRYKTGVSNAASYALVQTSYAAPARPRVAAPNRSGRSTGRSGSSGGAYRVRRRKYAYHPVVKTFAILLPVLALVLGQFLQYFINARYQKVLIFDLLSSEPTSMATLVFSTIFAAIGTACVAFTCWQTADADLVMDSWILNGVASALYAAFPCFAGYAGLVAMPFITFLYLRNFCEFIPLPPIITAFAFGQIFQYAAFLNTGRVMVLTNLIGLSNSQDSFNTLAFLIVTSVMSGAAAGIACYLGHYFMSRRSKLKAYVTLAPFALLCTVPSLCSFALLPYAITLICIKNRRVIRKVAPILMAVILLFISVLGIVSAFYTDKNYVAVSNYSELEANLGRNYAAIDISGIDSTIDNKAITASRCDTLKLKGDPDRYYDGVTVNTSAANVILEDFNFGDEKKLNPAMTFSNDCKVTFTGKSSVNGQIKTLSKCTKITFANDGDDSVVLKNCEFDFTQKNENFNLSFRNVSARFASGISYARSGTLTLDCSGEKNYFAVEGDSSSTVKKYDLKSGDGSAGINAKKLNIKLDGNLTVVGGTVNGAGIVGIKSEQLAVSGKGNLNVSGGNAAVNNRNDGSSGYNGGNGVESKTLSCDGDVVFTVKGGNGGTGAQGITGTAGAAGQKGNNESQGKDPVYGWNGRPGGDGGKGGKGGTGGTGGDALILDEMPQIGNNAQLALISGDGGNGGKGGSGGRGGRGGDGGDDDNYSILWIEDMSGGEGGAGGNGGAGGEGGEGGVSGSIFIVGGDKQTMSYPRITKVAGKNGTEGEYGTVGSKGANGSHGYAGIGG